MKKILLLLLLCSHLLYSQDDEYTRYILKKHKGKVLSVAFSPADTIIATGGEDKKIHFHHLETGELLSSI